VLQQVVATMKRFDKVPAWNISSTDANIPISLGVPGIRLGGGGKGDGAHSLGESYDDGPNGWLGPQWALLVVTSLAGVHSVTP
jgi:hypothetical protein